MFWVFGFFFFFLDTGHVGYGLPDQGLNPYPLHQKVDSTTEHQGRPLWNSEVRAKTICVVSRHKSQAALSVWESRESKRQLTSGPPTKTGYTWDPPGVSQTEGRQGQQQPAHSDICVPSDSEATHH